jgi:hypothetical protein
MGKAYLLWLIGCVTVVVIVSCNRPAGIQIPGAKVIEPETIDSPPPKIISATASTRVVRTELPGTQASYPVTGSIVLQEGRCCAGGIVGQTITIQVDYAAHSPFGKVEEMRTRFSGSCMNENEFVQEQWRPFVVQEKVPMQISAINWIGYWAGVQYRDSQGNLSPVYCDDISLEGMPAPPTP